MLIADAEGDRYRDDAPEDGSPEGIDELLVAAEEQDELVARFCPDALQVVEDAGGALVQLRVGNLAGIVLAFVIGDALVYAAVVRQQLSQGSRCRSQRRSNLMCRGWRVRRLICASSSSGSRGT